MPKHRRLLIVVADGEHVRFVRPALDNALQSERRLESGAAPGHGDHARGRDKFAQLIAELLKTGAARDEFNELILVAPPHTMSAIRNGLDVAASSRIVGVLEKDLVKTPDDELTAHLWPWVRPVHRAAG